MYPRIGSIMPLPTPPHLALSCGPSVCVRPRSSLSLLTTALCADRSTISKKRKQSKSNARGLWEPTQEEEMTAATTSRLSDLTDEAEEPATRFYDLGGADQQQARTFPTPLSSGRRACYVFSSACIFSGYRLRVYCSMRVVSSCVGMHVRFFMSRVEPRRCCCVLPAFVLGLACHDLLMYFAFLLWLRAAYSRTPCIDVCHV